MWATLGGGAVSGPRAPWEIQSRRVPPSGECSTSQHIHLSSILHIMATLIAALLLLLAVEAAAAAAPAPAPACSSSPTSLACLCATIGAVVVQGPPQAPAPPHCRLWLEQQGARVGRQQIVDSSTPAGCGQQRGGQGVCSADAGRTPARAEPRRPPLCGRVPAGALQRQRRVGVRRHAAVAAAARLLQAALEPARRTRKRRPRPRGARRRGPGGGLGHRGGAAGRRRHPRVPRCRRRRRQRPAAVLEQRLLATALGQLHGRGRGRRGVPGGADAAAAGAPAGTAQAGALRKGGERGARRRPSSSSRHTRRHTMRKQRSARSTTSVSSADTARARMCAAWCRCF